MFKVLAIISRNKLFYIFAFLIILLFPSSLYMQSDKDKTLIVTSVGIDKKDDEYSLTVLSIIPKGSNDVNANLEVFEGTGDSISQALDNISINVGKKVGLAHCDSIIFSMDITEENITKILDYFIRTANLTTNAVLVVAEGESKELLEATKSSNNMLDLSLKNIVIFQEDRSTLDNVTIDKFYRNYLSESSTFHLPILSTEKPDKGSETESSSGSQDNSSAESEGGGGSGGEQIKIKNDGKILVLKDGKKSRILTEDEMFIYSLLSPSSKHIRIAVDNINDECVNNSREVYQQVDKIVVPKYKFEEGKPIMEYSVWLSVMIDEIISEDNFHYSSIDGLKNYLTDTVINEINNQVQEKLEATRELMREHNTDVLDIYDNFNAFKHGKWQKYLSTLEDENNYLSDVDVRIKLILNYVI